MDGTIALYVYDAFGQRVCSTVNSTVYDFIYNNRGQAVDELSGSSWVWGHAGSVPGITYTNGSTYFDHADWVGTVRARSNASGTRTETCTSLAFGDSQSCIGTDETPQHFAGLQADSESNLQHAWFRQLSTTEGRWTVPDPSGLAAVSPSNPQSWNRYAHVMNRPHSAADPLGLLIQDCVWTGCGPGGPVPGPNSGIDWDSGCSYCADTGPGGIFLVGPMWDHEAQEEARHESIITTGWDPELGINRGSTKYWFTGGDGSIFEQQKELAAIQLGQAACSGQDASAIGDCIQQAYDTMGTVLDSKGNPLLVGGNYNFDYTVVSIDGQGINPSELGCAGFGGQTRCGIFDSLHFHADGTFHVDTGNAWFVPLGSLVHLGWDVIGGNTVWQAGIPRPWW